MELARRIALDEPHDAPDSARKISPIVSPIHWRDSPNGAGGARDVADALDAPPASTPDPAPEGAPPVAPSSRRLWRRLLSNRLVQFGIVAGVLFAVAPRAQAPSRIEMRHEALDKLHGAAAAKAGHVVLPASDMEAVERRAIEDEILFREGVRMGLDDNDGVVRNRVIQKTLFFAEELSDASRSATETELRAYFDEHAAEFAKPARVRFQHVFAHQADALPSRPADDQGTPGHPLSLGEPSPIPAETAADERGLVEALGVDAARAVLALPEGRWAGPIASPFGAHYVKVLAREGTRAARFEDVRPRVIERLSLERRERAVSDFLAKAFARYEVSLDGARLATLQAPHRVAVRSVTSGED